MDNKMELTKKEAKALKLIQKERAVGNPVTSKDLQKFMKYASRTMPYMILKSLISKGLVVSYNDRYYKLATEGKNSANNKQRKRHD